MWTYYRRKQDIEEFFNSDTTISHTRFIRLFIVGLLDILFTLPAGVVSLAIGTLESLQSSPFGIPFYPGWHYTHHPWAIFVPTSAWTSQFLFLFQFQIYYQGFLYPVFSLIIFLFFGLRPTARGKYRSWFWTVARPLGIKPPVIREDDLDMTFGPPPPRPTNTGIR